jgi:hypothetical protein
MLPCLPRLIEDLVDGVHYDDARPPPWRGKLSRAYGYDALALAHSTLAAFVTARSTPVFRVAHAALRELGYNLPASPKSARREIERIFARVRSEWRCAPGAEPDKAGPACLRNPSIAIILRRRDRRPLLCTAAASNKH